MRASGWVRGALCALGVGALGVAGCASPAGEGASSGADPSAATPSGGGEATSPSVPAEALTPLPGGPAVDRAFPPAVRAVLEGPEGLEVFALVCERGPAPDEAALDGYPIVAGTGPLAPRDARAVVAAVYQDVLDGSAMAMCFEPHHGVRARRDGHVVDLAICYACLQVYVFLDGKYVAGAAMATAARPLLDRLIGPHPADRLVRGKTLAEWTDVLIAAAGGVAPLDAVQHEGVLAIAESFAWGARCRAEGAALLRDLGPRAAPAVPALRDLLRAGTPAACDDAVQLLVHLGPAAAPAAPELIALLRRDPTALLERDEPDEPDLDPAQRPDETPREGSAVLEFGDGDDEAHDDERLSSDALEDLRLAALRTLVAAGLDALRPAEALLREVAASDATFEADVAREGLAALDAGR